MRRTVESIRKRYGHVTLEDRYVMPEILEGGGASVTPEREVVVANSDVLASLDAVEAVLDIAWLLDALRSAEQRATQAEEDADAWRRACEAIIEARPSVTMHVVAWSDWGEEGAEVGGVYSNLPLAVAVARSLGGTDDPEHYIETVVIDKIPPKP